MKFHEGASYLLHDDWSSISKFLTPLEEEMKNIASGFDLKFKTGVRWPEFELCRNGLLLYRSLRLGLNSNYLEDKHIFFEVTYFSCRKLFFSQGKETPIKKLSRYSSGDMANTRVILADIRNKVDEYLCG